MRSRLLVLLAGYCAFGVHEASALEDSTLVFAGDRANPPYEWLENGTPRGFAVDLARAIGEAGGVTTQHRLTEWSEALSALEAGTVDVVTMFRSADREERFLFSPPFHYVHFSIYGRADSPAIVDVAGLSGFRVAVERGSHAQEQLEKTPGAVTLISATSAAEALVAVRDGRADYAILPAQVAAMLLARSPMPVRSMGPPVWSLPFAFAVAAHNRDLVDWLTERLYEVIRAGTYSELFSEWEDQLDPVPHGHHYQLLVLATVLAFGLGLAALAWVWRLRTMAAAGHRKLETEARRRELAESRVRWLAEHDAETEFLRPSAFAARVADALSAAGAEADAKELVALRPADIDRVFHSRGHDAGSALLKDFAVWLESLNFQICGQDRDVFLIFDDRRSIRQQLYSSISADDTAILKASRDRSPFFAGACAWSAQAEDVPELLRRAEMALARAVEIRQSWIDYRPSMEPDRDQHELICLFRESAGEGIYPLFQPQLDLRSGALVGAEALVRWEAPGRGLVPPEAFIHLVEDAGLVHHVTRRMIREATRVGAAIRDRGLVCPISVNVTASDLLNPHFRRIVQDSVALHQGRCRDLKLELTETSFARESDALILSMTMLRADGVLISIDDFGTGYSSLSYLSSLPISELKIDRSFVRDMLSNAKSRGIIRSTIEMGHELGLEVIAEGVENEQQMQVLKSFGCDRVQGYLISKPVREEEFFSLVEMHDRQQSKRRYGS